MTMPMTNSLFATPSGRAHRADVDLGNRRAIGSYADYGAAQKTVDTLSDRGFPVEHVSIVGTDLRVVERVIGRMTTSRAAAAGAASGAWFGLLIGLIFSIGSTGVLAPVLAGIVLGAAFGAAFGAATHAALRGTRDFTSTQSIVAGRYDVLVADELFVRASFLLSGTESMPADGYGAPVTTGWGAPTVVGGQHDGRFGQGVGNGS